jgi:hypothetical protein
MTIDEKKKRLRAAKAKLRVTKCTCILVQHDWNPPKHDPFDVSCPRTLAEIEHDTALAICGIEI